MDENSSMGGRATLGIGLLVFAILAISLGPALYTEMRADKVRASGERLTGTVAKLEDTGNRFNDNPVVVVTVDFELNGAKKRSQVEDCISVVHLPRFQPGQQIQIWVDPQDATRIALEKGL